MITHGTYLNPENVVAGNSVRAYYLAKGLVHHGIEVVHTYPRALGDPETGDGTPLSGISICAYDSKEELARLITRQSPDALIIGYWELMKDLPNELSVPIVLDVVAPRVLEAMYQDNRNLDEEIRRMLISYRKADRFLVGNERQKHFLLSWLIMAGFDCRQEIPIDVIPISTEPGTPLPRDPYKKKWRFVSGGVSWPWRKTKKYFNAMVMAMDDMSDIDSQLVLFSGKYIYAPDGETNISESRNSQWSDKIVKNLPLRPYGEMVKFIREQCDIGVELAERNVEREYSQSFRAIEFLRCGLPLICNHYLELADHVAEYDAGWLVKSPEDITGLLHEILSSPDEWRHKSKNAIRLVSEQFNYVKTVEPLVEFLNHPSIPGRRKEIPVEGTTPKSRGYVEPDVNSQRNNRWTSFLLRGIRYLLSKFRGKPRATAIAIVSRSDIFPANHGAAVKIDRTAWGLSHHADAVYLITDDRQRYYVYEKGNRREKYFPLWLSVLAPPRFFVRSRLLRKGIPPADAFLYYPLLDWSYIVRLLYLSVKYPITIFQAEFPAYAYPCLWARRLFGGRTILVEHNVEYQRFKDQIPDLNDKAYTFLRHTEIKLCNNVDVVVTVSERDRARLAADGVDDSRIHVIPHGVDLDQFGHARPQDIRGRFNIPAGQTVLVYHGIYLYPPNLEAMQIMANEILPRLHAKGIRANVLAVGGYPPKDNLHDDIIFTGFVDSVAPYLLAADIAVVPLQRGGGTRMKVLDYFAASLPVVSTSKGIEGIPIKNGVHAVIEDDYDRFAGAIIELVDNPKKAKEIADQGRAFVETLDWKTVAVEYIQLMR